MGNFFELIGASFVRSHGYGTRFPFNFVVRPIDNGFIDKLVREARSSNGSGVISKKNSIRKIVKCLKKNETVAILMDQNQVREEGVFVDFFGRKACTTPVVSLLALRTGAAVLPAFAVREAPGKIKIVVQEEVPVISSGNRKSDTIHYTQIFTTIIEEFVTKYADQWFWVHNRWKTRP
ncbi:MAG: lysophospholipid acyltransferase family protein [Nitrospinota bacterium]